MHIATYANIHLYILLFSICFNFLDVAFGTYISTIVSWDFVVEEADEHWRWHDYAVYVATLISDHHSTFVSFTVARVSYLKCTLWCICLNL